MVNEVPAVFRNARLERRVAALALRVEVMERRVLFALGQLTNGMNDNSRAIQLLGNVMREASEALPGEQPLMRDQYGRAN